MNNTRHVAMLIKRARYKDNQLKKTAYSFDEFTTDAKNFYEKNKQSIHSLGKGALVGGGLAALLSALSPRMSTSGRILTLLAGLGLGIGGKALFKDFNTSTQPIEPAKNTGSGWGTLLKGGLITGGTALTYAGARKLGIPRKSVLALTRIVRSPKIRKPLISAYKGLRTADKKIMHPIETAKSTWPVIKPYIDKGQQRIKDGWNAVTKRTFNTPPTGTP